LTGLEELDNGGTEAKAILDEAHQQLWRLREALEGNDEEAQTTVIRETLSKAEVRFVHGRTQGSLRSAGRTRPINRPVALVLYVRPGLGLARLTIQGSPLLVS
jgi:hypothetical protein